MSSIAAKKLGVAVNILSKLAYHRPELYPESSPMVSDILCQASPPLREVLKMVSCFC